MLMPFCERHDFKLTKLTKGKGSAPQIVTIYLLITKSAI